MIDLCLTFDRRLIDSCVKCEVCCLILNLSYPSKKEESFLESLQDESHTEAAS